jgi:hypothetical protein
MSKYDAGIFPKEEIKKAYKEKTGKELVEEEGGDEERPEPKSEHPQGQTEIEEEGEKGKKYPKPRSRYPRGKFEIKDINRALEEDKNKKEGE